MKSMLLWLGSGLLVTTLAVAQDTPSAEPTPNSQSSRTDQTSSNVIRGCLSGSAGNYTVTDQNGMQYTIAGPDNQLASRVGHEIEVTTRQDQTSESASQGDQSTAHSTNTVQVSDVRDIAPTCKTAGSSPMENDRGDNPKGSATTSEPPQQMAMLQQQSAPGTGTQEQKPGVTTQQQQQQTTPPVSSQTPSTSVSPTGSGQQTGTSPANNTGMTESEANHDAQAARQGELNTNPNGETTGRGVDNQGVNNPSTTNPNAVPDSRNSVSPSGTQPPQSNADDANKPLYERQATDIPWANHSTENNGTANPPQSNPH